MDGGSFGVAGLSRHAGDGGRLPSPDGIGRELSDTQHPAAEAAAQRGELRHQPQQAYAVPRDGRRGTGGRDLPGIRRRRSPLRRRPRRRGRAGRRDQGRRDGEGRTTEGHLREGRRAHRSSDPLRRGGEGIVLGVDHDEIRPQEGGGRRQSALRARDQGGLGGPAGEVQEGIRSAHPRISPAELGHRQGVRRLVPVPPGAEPCPVRPRRGPGLRESLPQSLPGVPAVEDPPGDTLAPRGRHVRELRREGAERGGVPLDTETDVPGGGCSSVAPPVSSTP